MNDLKYYYLKELFSVDEETWDLYYKISNLKIFSSKIKKVLCVCRNEKELKIKFNDYKRKLLMEEVNFMFDEKLFRIYVFSRGIERNVVFIFKTINELKKNTDGLRITDVRFFD